MAENAQDPVLTLTRDSRFLDDVGVDCGQAWLCTYDKRGQDAITIASSLSRHGISGHSYLLDPSARSILKQWGIDDADVHDGISPADEAPLYARIFREP